MKNVKFIILFFLSISYFGISLAGEYSGANYSNNPALKGIPTCANDFNLADDGPYFPCGQDGLEPCEAEINRMCAGDDVAKFKCACKNRSDLTRRTKAWYACLKRSRGNYASALKKCNY